jgi:hypothetical protein
VHAPQIAQETGVAVLPSSSLIRQTEHSMFSLSLPSVLLHGLGAPSDGGCADLRHDGSVKFNFLPIVFLPGMLLAGFALGGWIGVASALAIFCAVVGLATGVHLLLHGHRRSERKSEDKRQGLDHGLVPPHHDRAR